MTAEPSNVVVTLIARVLAWQDGADPEHLDAVASTTLMLDYAQQCWEDLSRAGKAP